MTERLYYTDAYLTHFTARVTHRSDDGRRVYLDRSAFYPTSGGQPHDLGSLGDIPIVDVVDEGAGIAHVLAEPLCSEHADGVVDWMRRFDHMQQHTGQHLLSAVFADRYGYDTLSVHFGPDYATLDLSTEVVPAEHLREAEECANALVTENRAVAVSFEDAAAAQGLRKASQREGELRVVAIEGVDRSACGGTHVRATGEIGPILLRRQEKMKRQARIEFLCGNRAVRRARRDFSVLSNLAISASASIDELPTLVSAQVEQIKAAESARRKLEDEVAGYRARGAWDLATPDERGVRWLVNRQAAGRADDARVYALAVAALPGAVFAACFDDARSILLAASADSGVDAGKRLKDALATVGGKGGGSPRLAQGNAPTVEALGLAWHALCLR